MQTFVYCKEEPPMEWLFVRGKLNIREAARRLGYWLDEAAKCPGASAKLDQCIATAKLLQRLIAERDLILIEED